MRTFMRCVVGTFFAWYVALWVFDLAFPYCNSGSLEGVEAACYLGTTTNYGPIYHALVMWTIILVPVAVGAVVLLGAIEYRDRGKDAA